MSILPSILAIRNCLNVEVDRAELIAKKADQLYRNINAEPRQKLMPLKWLSEQERGSVVVSLAFSFAAMTWLAELSRSSSKQIFVQKTPLIEKYYEWLHHIQTRKSKNIQLLTPIEMLKYRQSENVIYITFPDHTSGSESTSVSVLFFRRQMLFYVLESLLVRKQRINAYCFNGSGFIKCDKDVSNLRPCKGALIDEAQWRANCIERAIRLSPEEYFGWSRIEAKTQEALLAKYQMRISAIEGFLRCWAMHEGPASDALHHMLKLIAKERRLLIASALTSAPAENMENSDAIK